MSKQSPKILIYDIEVTPAKAYIYPPYYDPKFVQEIEPQMIMSMSYMWSDDKKPKFISLLDNWTLKSITEGSATDEHLCELIKSIIDEADILVGHNSDKFDIKHINGRLAYWNIELPSPVEMIDTVKLARKVGNFASNSLNYLGQYFGIGEKDGSHGSLWYDCMNGSKKAWKAMKKYNDKDVLLTRDLFNKLMPYVPNKFNLSKYIDGAKRCPTCGSLNYQCRGVSATKTRFYKSYACQSCGSWFRSDKSFSTRVQALEAPKGI